MIKSPQSDWTELLKAFKASGQTQRTWCQANGIKIHTLRYWLGKERKISVSNSENREWLKLQVQGDVLTPSPQSIYVQIGSVSVAVHPGFDPQHLLSVMRTLSTL